MRDIRRQNDDDDQVANNDEERNGRQPRKIIYGVYMAKRIYSMMRHDVHKLMRAGV